MPIAHLPPLPSATHLLKGESGHSHACIYSRAGNSLIGFPSECSFFAQKWANERFAQKNEQFTPSLIFGERPERIAHGRSFLVSNLSDLLTSLIFGERPERFTHIAHQKRGN